MCACSLGIPIKISIFIQLFWQFLKWLNKILPQVYLNETIIYIIIETYSPVQLAIPSGTTSGTENTSHKTIYIKKYHKIIQAEGFVKE